MTGLQESTNMNHDIIVQKRRWGLNVPKVQVRLVSIFGCCPRCWSSSPTITPAHFDKSGGLTAVWQHRQHAQSPPDHFCLFFFGGGGFLLRDSDETREALREEETEIKQLSLTGPLAGSEARPGTKVSRLSMPLEVWMSLRVRVRVRVSAPSAPHRRRLPLL